MKWKTISIITLASFLSLVLFYHVNNGRDTPVISIPIDTLVIAEGVTTAGTSLVNTTRTTATTIWTTVGADVTEAPYWTSTLYTPTFIERINGTWIIVDCWHHRIISSATLESPFNLWASLGIGPSDEMIVPHSVATDGQWIVTESSNGGSDGDNHTVLVYTLGEAGSFHYHQSVPACPGNAARRPHRIIYDNITNAFYLYLTNPPHLAKLVPTKDGVVPVYCRPIPQMKGAYGRSIVIKDGSIYITAGPKAVTELSLENLNFKRYYGIKHLRMQTGKMNDLAYFDGWWYATSTVKCNIVRFRSLHNFRDMQILTQQLDLCHEFDRSKKRCRGGTPYYLTKIGHRIYVPYIFHCSGVVSFIDKGDTISDVQHHWGDGWVEQRVDIAVRGTRW